MESLSSDMEKWG